uniref:Uncharacterized protein n=1 Tax=Nelumbo nucifera TaxID=4432 RepID=A0A822Y7D9_NELNU|nr:TPA_asm: hypothetical protein HUJ06_029888 [Nelumbo nucifera]
MVGGEVNYHSGIEPLVDAEIRRKSRRINGGFGKGINPGRKGSSN